MLGFRFDVPSEREGKAELESRLIEYLLKLRNEFRQEKEWKKADEIRDALFIAQGLFLWGFRPG